MKRRNLCRTKKMLAVIIAASMCMNPGMMAMAEDVIGGSVIENNVVGSGVIENNVDNTVDVTAPKEEKDVTEKVEGNATSSSYTPAVNVSSNSGYSAEVTVTGDAKATNTDGSATGVKAESYGKKESSSSDSSSSDKNSSTSVTVEGEVSASSNSSSATGINASSSNGGSTDVTAEKSVSATGKEGSYASGVNARAEGTGSTTNVTVGDNLTVSSAGGSTGINASAYGENSSVRVSVGGNVSATKTSDNSGSSDSSVINTYTSKDSSSVNVNVGGNVTGNGGITASGSGQTNITVGGSVSQNSGSGYSPAISTNTYRDSSSVNVTVGGDVTGNGGITASGSGNTDINVGGNVIGNGGIYAYGSGNTDINVGGNVTGSGGITAYGSGQTNITVGGSVVQESQKSETQLTGSESSSGRIAISLSDGEHEGSEKAEITVKVTENVTSDSTAVNITKNNEKSDIRLEVDGTLSGGEHNIVLSEKSNIDNLDITVWRVDTSDGKNVVESITNPTSEDWSNFKSAYNEWETSGNSSTPAPEEPKPTYTANLEAEKMINYIIKVADVQTPGGNLGIAGASAGGVYTAHQNDTVYLEVTIPDGYTIDGFYNVDGAADVSVISGDGKYYLNVPRGGGVFVGVKMKKIESTATLDNTGSASTSTSYSTYGSGDYSDSDSNDQNWTVGNGLNANSGNITTLPPEFTGLQIHALTMGGDTVQTLSDVLTFIDPLAALNNFMDKGIPTQGTQNVIGAGIVDFHNLFVTSLTDTVDVPVTANVKANQSYTVLFSDGTSIVVPCIMDGLLTIPFNKNAAGLTYMIYGTDMNPGAFVGLTTSNWTP